MRFHTIGTACVLIAGAISGCSDSSPLENSKVPVYSQVLTPAAGTALSGFFGNYVPGTPAVTLTDKQGKPLVGLAVNFAAAGGGQLTGAHTVTDSAGHASLTSWRLGANGAQQVTATAPDAAPVSFTAAATAPPASTFRIEVRYASGTVPTAAQAAAFDSAAARWTRIILAGGAPYPIHEVVAGCGDLTGETVDGVVITAELKDIDGAGQILGSAGPCILRDADYLPAQGIMQFDTSDLALLEARGQLQNVILHEMGHVLGFGTVWDLLPIGQPTQSLLLRTPASDPVFTGLASRAALYGLAGATGFPGTPVPVENSGGQGTIFSHWREATFGPELMTGWLNAGFNPLSALTIAQFHDLGYQVNDALGESFAFAALLQAAGQAPLPLIEGQLTMPLLVIDRSGHAVRRVPRVFK